MKDLSMKLETLKLLEENTGSTLHDVVLNRILFAQELRPTIIT